MGAVLLKLDIEWVGYSANPALGAVLPYKGLMGTYSQPGYVFRDFCLKQGIDFIIFFCLNQGIDFISFCLKQGIFSWLINSLHLCSKNVLNRVSKIGILT